jgi:hypothetical protein
MALRKLRPAGRVPQLEGAREEEVVWQEKPFG